MPLLDLAHAADERGFDCLVVGEHTHIPVSRETPWPAGGESARASTASSPIRT